jgi:hypothetical protein
MNENAFGEEVPNEIGKEGSHLPVGRVVPDSYVPKSKLKPIYNFCLPDPLLRQLTVMLDSVLINAARKNARHGQHGNPVEEFAYWWHKGRLAAEDEYYNLKDSRHEEEANEKTKT